MDIVNIALFAYSFILLLAVWMSAGRSKYRYMSDKIFRIVLKISMLLLIADLFARFHGVSHPIYPFLAHVGNFVSFAMSPAIPILWLLYIDYRVYSDTNKTTTFAKKLSIICIFNLLLVVISLNTGWLYTIDANNIYTRGPLYIIPHIITGALLLWATIFLILKRKRIEKGNLSTYIAFSVIPAFSLIIQILYTGIAYIPSAIVLGVVVLFIFVQNNRVRTDYLTGVFNRRQMDYYLEDKIIQAKNGKPFTGILFDLNNLKGINDTHGHQAGDEAIKNTAYLLNTCNGKSDFLARYGGDEFFIITTKYEHNDVDDLLNTIQEKFRQFNQNHKLYQLNVSAGYYTYYKETKLSSEEFIKLIDKRMYENKLTAKNKITYKGISQIVG